MNEVILSLITFLPLAGVLLLLFIPSEQSCPVERVHTGGYGRYFYSLAPACDRLCNQCRLPVCPEHPLDQAGPFRMNYHVGIDGISLWLVMLTTFIMPIAVLSTWNAVHEKVKGYMACLLLLQVGMLGAFISIDLFLFYIFWEVMLIPMYFIIGIWGGKNRIYAAVKFFIYTMVGSLLMLVALIALYFKGLSVGSYRFQSAQLLRDES